MSVFAIKVLAVVAILAVGIAGGVIPILAARYATSRRYLSLCNALAGGIFLGAGFLHLLPEADEALKGRFDYPLALLLASVGVCVLLLTERVVFDSVRPQAATTGSPNQGPVSTWVVLIVLSVHSLIAGLALGLEADAAASVLVMLAILFHKGSAAFALVASAQASGATRRQLRTALAVFVSMTPAGIILGAGASTFVTGPAAELAEGTFNALAAGTFIYVAILDVIGAEMPTVDERVARFTHSALVGDDDVPFPVGEQDALAKFCLVVTGLAAMALLAMWV